MPKKKGTVVKTTKVTTTRRPKAPRRKNKKPKAGRKNGVGRCTYEYARSLADPFQFSSCIPDGSTGTGAFSIKQMHTLSTGTGGCCGFMAMPIPNHAVIADTGSASATFTVGANWTALTQSTSIQSFYSKYRPVSCGIRAMYTGNTIDDQGVILCAQFSGGVAASSLNGQSLSGAAALAQYYDVYPLRSGAQITWRPEDMMDVAEYNGYATTTLTTGLAAFPYIALIVYGAAVSKASVLQLEVVWNFEGQYNNSTFNPGGMNAEPLRPAEVGWYDRAKDLLIGIDSIIPLMAGSNVGKAAGNAAIGYLGSMANGMLSPRGFNSRLPRLTY